MKAIKKAQTGGTYYTTSDGRVGRFSGSAINDNIVSLTNESIDTTGYSKGKKQFTKTKRKTFEKPSSEKVKREDVPKVISELKRGATKKMDLRTLNQRKKSKMKNGGTVAKDGKWIQKATASIKRRGTEGKCTPITKPGCTGKAKALAKTFKKMAAKRKKK
jgi:hypothetical protein